MAQNDIGIDLGTTSVVIYVEGKGIVLSEPTVVAVDTDTGKVLAVGDDAYRMVGRTPAHIMAVRPLKDGVISDHVLTREIVRRFLVKAYQSPVVKPRVAVCVPAAISGIESDAAVEAVVAAGARQVFLIDEPIAAALGAGIDITRPRGHLVVDIGGGTSDIAVISMGGKVQSSSIKVAGNTLDAAIVRVVRDKFKLAIGEKTAEILKRTVGCCAPEAGFSASMEVKGRSLENGLPRRQLVTTGDLYEAITECVEELATAIHAVLERTPPELAGDIYTEGMLLTGGGALLPGLSLYMSRRLKIRTQAAEDPVNCVARGTGMSLSMADRLESGFRDATPGIGRR
ncbi:rod shape-determining protein [Anaerofilum sp. BX8]|uniref:Cell shape-determining protein MreB n=1 Tax=Anaerofilum hominis TaxID=2763016 RepID=A0A923IDC1_9FIRM|nr:rod shape-determining protein [Anaerofilum hominis]MBC5580202.1 rod shape-determining protein [Anaerofilum hominis]